MCKRRVYRRDVIFLGAGAMKDLGLPLANELFEDMHKYFQNIPYERNNSKFNNFFCDYKKFCNFLNVLMAAYEWYKSDGLFSFPNNKIDYKTINPELVFTLGDSFKFLLKDMNKQLIENCNVPCDQNYKKLLEKFNNLLSEYLILKAFDYGEKRREGEKTYLTKIVKSSDTFITTNWDVMLEMEFKSSGDVLNPMRIYGYDIENSQISGKKRKDNVVKIYKLHGYSGLYKKNEKVYLDAKYKILFTQDKLELQDKLQNEKFVIHPSYIKILESNHMLKVWKQAQQKLLDAETIDIVGYSLPDADQAVRTLLMTLRDTKKHINVILPDEKMLEAWKEFLGGGGNIHLHECTAKYFYCKGEC